MQRSNEQQREVDRKAHVRREGTGSACLRFLACLAAVGLWLAATAPAALAFAVSGVVYGGSSPLPNTLVEALQDGTTTVVDSDTTNAAGQYSLSLAAGTYDLRVSPPGGSGFGDETIQNLTVSADTTYDVILLGQGASGISGTVTGRGNNPVSGATIYLYDYATGQQVDSQAADAAGHYVFTVPNGTYSIGVYNYAFDSDAPPYAGCYQGPVTVSGNTTLDLQMPVSQVSGTVSGAGAGVLSGASIQVQSSYYDSTSHKSCSANVTTTSNASGAYAALVMQSAPGYSVYFTVQPPSGQPFSILTQSSFVTADTTIDFTLPSSSGHGISGTVYGYNGNPIAGDRVTLYTTGWNTLAQVITDAAGHYSFASSDGNYNVEISEYSTESPYAPQGSYSCYRYSVAASGPTVLDLTVPVIQMSGSVSDEASNPVSGAKVVSDSGYALNTLSCRSSSSITTNGSGVYTARLMRNTSGYTARLVVSPPSSSTTLGSLGDAVVLNGDLTRNFVLPSAAAHSVSGTLRGIGGNPIASAWVNAKQNQMAVRTASTDASGHFTLPVADGAYGFEAASGAPSPFAPSDYFYCDQSSTWATVSGVTTADYTLPLVQVTGRVTDSNGAPVAAVEVSTTSYKYDSAAGRYCYSADTRSSDASGLYTALAVVGSADFHFTPPAASGFSQAFLSAVDLAGDRSQILVLQRPDLTPPDITSGPTVVHLSDTSVSIVWTTNEASDSRVEYGVGSLNQSFVLSAPTTQHTVTLTGLLPNTTYQFRVGSTDESGNGPTYSGTSTFSSQVPPGDIDAPVITGGPSVAFTDQTSAILVWNTDEPSSTVVHYGTTNALGTTVSGPAGVYQSSHSLQLFGLLPNTVYYYTVESTDPDGNGPTTSTVLTFQTTGSPDTSAPAISNVQITSITDTTITIEWDTDEPATSGVSFNDGTVYDVLSDPNLVLHHEMTLSSLALTTTYHLTVSSTDAVGNGPSVAGPLDATTGTPCYGNLDACDDGNACTSNDVCDGLGGCHGEAITCDDGNSCTHDSCEPATGCVAQVALRDNCRNPGRSLLLLKDNPDDGRDRIVWKWLRGDSALATFGAPSATTEYGLCVYDTLGGVPRAVMNVELEPQAHWTPNNKGFNYVDPSASQYGAKKLLLRAGAGDQARLIFTGQGSSLTLPLPGEALPLYQSPKVMVQLHNSEGECWQSEHDAPALRNKNGVFRDR